MITVRFLFRIRKWKKQYALMFAGTMGDAHKRYDGRILAVGIGYNKKDKQHRCKVEVLQS